MKVSPAEIDLRGMAGLVPSKLVRSELQPNNSRYESQSGRNRLKGDGGSRSRKVSPVGAAAKEWSVKSVKSESSRSRLKGGLVPLKSARSELHPKNGRSESTYEQCVSRVP